jgi:hypothetical protein
VLFVTYMLKQENSSFATMLSLNKIGRASVISA